MSDGRRKCDIKTDKQLEDAYKSIKNGWIHTVSWNPNKTRKKEGKVKQKGGKLQVWFNN